MLFFFFNHGVHGGAEIAFRIRRAFACEAPRISNTDNSMRHVASDSPTKSFLRTSVPFVVKTPFASVALFLLLAPSLIPFSARAAEFSYENLEGQIVSIDSQPVFIITTKSESDLKDALRCASYIESLANKPNWVIDLAWPQSEFAKRLAAKRLIKSEFMKRRCAILDDSRSPRNLVALLDSRGVTVWNSATYPSDTDWESALAKWRQSSSR